MCSWSLRIWNTFSHSQSFSKIEYQPTSQKIRFNDWHPESLVNFVDLHPMQCNGVLVERCWGKPQSAMEKQRMILVLVLLHTPAFQPNPNCYMATWQPTGCFGSNLTATQFERHTAYQGYTLLLKSETEINGCKWVYFLKGHTRNNTSIFRIDVQRTNSEIPSGKVSKITLSKPRKRME